MELMTIHMMLERPSLEYKIYLLNIQMEGGFTMAFHAFLIVVVLYVFMRYVLGQRHCVAEDRSVALGAVALLYMVLYGHGLPRRVNPNML